MSTSSTSTNWVVWPFRALWQMLTWILEFAGRLLLGFLGFVLVIVGILISLSIIGAVVGVPMIIFGFLMMLRAIF